MKILQVNCVYDKGSTGKITKDIHRKLMSKGIESVVIYGRGNKSDEKNVHKLCSESYAKFSNLLSRITGVMYGGCYFSTQRIINKIRAEKPEIVHLQCINGYFCNIFRLLKFLKQEKIPTILTLHAEFMYTANCGYAGECNQWVNGCQKCPRLKEETLSHCFDRTNYSWKKFKEIYEDWNELQVVACSDWIKSRALQSGTMGHLDIRTIHNGIDNSGVFQVKDTRGKIQAKHNVDKNNKIALFVAPVFSKLKGYDLFLQLVKECEDLPVTFLSIGDNDDANYANLINVGKVYNQDELSDYYSAADVFLIFSRCENYPTVCLEAISCGTPVVGFDIGGIKETIYEGMGETVPFGNIKMMKESMQKILANGPCDENVEKAREYNSADRMVNDYINLYKELILRS